MRKVNKKLTKEERDTLDAFLYGPSVISETEAEYLQSLNYGSGYSLGSLRISTTGHITNLNPHKDRFTPAKQVVADDHHEIVSTCIPGLCVLKLKTR